MYLASLEVDQRQRFIHEADTLQELIGASHLIGHTVPLAEKVLNSKKDVKLVWPVSGVLRFESNDLESLAETLWELRAALDRLGLPCTIGIVPRTNNLDDDFAALERQVRLRKDAKTGAVPVPALPFFARCKILPDQPANEGGESWRSRHRSKFYDDYKVRVAKFDEFATAENDSYIAIVKGDIDGLGRLLSQLKFEALAAALGIPATEAALKFSTALTECMNSAVDSAVKEFVHNYKTDVLALYCAGDDLLLLLKRHHALRVVNFAAERFSDLVDNNPTICKALELAGLLGKERLTISFGVLFAKKGFPFSVAADMVDSVNHNAKKLRKTLPDGHKSAIIDFHWLASSAREDIDHARQVHETYQDGYTTLHLFDRPWPQQRLDQFLKAGDQLKNFPSRKIHQLGEILRLGKILSETAYSIWLSRLGATEKEALSAALEAIGHSDISSPWVDNRTPLLDLQLILDIHAGQERKP